MPNYSNAIVAMTSFFDTAWNNATAVLWGSDDNTAIPSGETWLRFNIRHVNGGQKTIGAPNANRFEHSGFITIQIFEPEGQRGLDAQAKANDVLEIYQGASSGGVHYSNVRVNEVGNDGHGFNQTNVIADFRYDNLT